MADDTTTTNDSIFYNSEVSFPRPIRFWLLLIFDIPAIVCTIFLLYHLFINRVLRQALHNHVIVIFLIFIFPIHTISIPSYIIYVHVGYVWIPTPAFCSFWSFVDVGLLSMLTMLMAFGSIERHILVFHRSWLLTRKKRFLIHYLPLSLITIYGISFYFIVIFFPPCENLYDFNQPLCSYPCYLYDTILNGYDLTVNCLFPTLLIIIFNILLLLRYIRQKQRMQRTIQWYKLRKMVIQLVSISSLYLFFYLPIIMISAVQFCGFFTETLVNAQLYTSFFIYFIPLLSPYVCLASLPELRKKLKIRWNGLVRLNNTVIPAGIHHR